jgi:SWI/SNF-related matrix-associated actin-dependent regulator of chromatin subfamily A-like protein 1
MKAQLNKNRLQVFFPYDTKLVEEIKTLPGRRYNPNDSSWFIKPSLESFEWLVKYNPQMDQETLSWVQEKIAEVDLGQEIKQIKRELGQALEAPPLSEIPPLVISPFKFQWVTPHYAEIANGRLLLADPMGLGKTFQAGLVTLLKRFKTFPVMIVCPKSAIGVWRNELITHFNMKSAVVNTELDALLPDIRFYIVTYRQLNKIKKDLGFLWIIDECHNVKNYKTQQTKNVKRLTKSAKHVLLLTGTPVQNRPSELFSLLTILDPEFPYSYTAYIKKFCNACWNGLRYNTTGATNLGELHELLKSNYLIRREKLAVLPQLPSKTRQVLTLSTVETPGNSILEIFSRNAKLKSVDPDFLEIVGAICQEEKTIVFGHHHVMLDAIESLCKTLNLPYIRIDGSTPLEDSPKQLGRTSLVAKFQDDPSIRVAILSTKAGGQSITLTASSTVIFAEMEWVPGDLLQAEDRVWRIGQKNAISIYYTIFSEFEKELYDMILNKLVIIEQILEGTNKENLSNQSLLSEMSKKFAKPISFKKD